MQASALGLFTLLIRVGSDSGLWSAFFRTSLGYGCKVCRRSGVASRWGKGLVVGASNIRSGALLKHTKSKSHQASFEAVGIINGVIVPSVPEFSNALDKLRAGEFSASAIEKMFSASKEQISRLTLCIGEACRQVSS